MKTRRAVLAAVAAGSIGLAGCMAVSSEDMACSGDCGAVDNFGADTASGFGSKPTEMYITFEEPFTGRVSVEAEETHGSGIEAADERHVEDATVVRFEFSGTVSSDDVVWTLEEAE